MSGDYWEDEVYAVPPLLGVERIDDQPVIDWVKRSLPMGLGRVAWSKVPGNHAHREYGEDDVLLRETAVSEICRRIGQTAVDHVGDSLSPYAVRFTRSHAPEILTALLEIPEHHYFLAADRSWLVVVSMEGDLDIVDRFEGGTGS